MIQNSIYGDLQNFELGEKTGRITRSFEDRCSMPGGTKVTHPPLQTSHDGIYQQQK